MKALKKLFSPRERLAIKEKTRYLIIDPDKHSDDCVEEINSEDNKLKRYKTWDQKKLELSSGHFSEQSFENSQSEVEIVKSISHE